MGNKLIIILFFIILIAFIFRLYELGAVPVSLNRDEVGLGYDAYSLYKTGRDQFNKFLPLTLRSSDDYKPAVYTYLSILPIALFGLNAPSVRLPSAIVGTLTVVITFFLARELFKQNQRQNIIAAASTFFLAISPWHIQFSRAAYEANISLFFIVAAVYFFLRGLSRSKLWILSGTFFGMSLLTYHAARFVGPLLFFFLILTNIESVTVQKKQLILLLVGFLVCLILVFPAIISKEAQVRLRVLSIYSSPKYEQESASNILVDEKLRATFWGKIIHNRRLQPLRWDSLVLLSQNYLRHLDPSIFIFGVDNPRLQGHHAPGVGVVYIWEVVLGLTGLAMLLRNGLNRRTMILPFWLFIGFLPAAITWEIPSYVRSILVLPMIQLLAGLGGVWILYRFQRRSLALGIIGFLGLSVWIASSIVIFSHQYFVHLNYETAENWRFGRKEAAILSEKLKKRYSKIVVSTNLDDPHVFFLFHLAYDPRKYLSSGGTIRGGWTATENHFDIYEFKHIPLKDDFQALAQANVLYVELASEIFPDARVVNTIYYPNGQEAIKLIDKNED